MHQVLSRLYTEATSRRDFLGGNFLEYFAVTIFFVYLTVIFTNYVAFNITTQLFAGSGDATAGFLWLNAISPGISPFLSATDSVNYPYGERLTGPTFITYMAIWIPLRILSAVFGPIAGLNLLMFLGYVSAAMSMYWLIRRATSSWAIGLLGGFATAFVPYAMYKSSGHIAYIFSAVFVLIIAAFIALWNKPTKIHSFIFAVAIALAFYTDGYYLLLASVLVICLCFGGVLYGTLITREKNYFWLRIKALILSLATLLIFVIPIAYTQYIQGDELSANLGSQRSNIDGELVEYRAWPVDFVMPAQSNPYFLGNATLDSLHAARNEFSNVGESTNYSGFTMLILCLAGVVVALSMVIGARKKKARLIGPRNQFLLIGSIAAFTVPILVAWMLSPEVHIAGLTIPMPGKLLAEFDIGLWRVMSRFFIPLHVVIVLFACMSLYILLRKYRLIDTDSRGRNISGLLIVLLLGGILRIEYATAVHNPPYDFTKLPEGYQWLKNQKDIEVVAELPVVDPLDARTGDYVTAQVFHKKKLINLKNPNEIRLTNSLGSSDNPELIDLAYHRGADVAITHNEECIQVSWGSIIHESGTLSKKDKMCIYRLQGPITADTLFIRYDEGINPSPNAPDQSTVVVKAAKVSLETFESSRPADMPSLNTALLSMLLTDTQGNLPSSWRVSQNGEVIAHGDLSQTAKLEILINPQLPVELYIFPHKEDPLDLGEYVLSDVIVSAK